MLEVFQQTIRRLGSRLLRRGDSSFVYVAMGDSTVEGIGASHHTRSYASLVYADLLRFYPNAQYHNLGKGGARVHDVAARQLQSALHDRPSLITISIGANDVIQRTSLSTFRRELLMLLEPLHSQTRALIFITTIPDFSFHHRIPKPVKPIVRLRIRQYNAAITRIAQALQVHVVDTFSESAVLAQRFPDAVSQDDFHPSDLGYVLWANMVLGEIHKYVRRHWSWLRRP